MKNNRSKLERKLDEVNHTMELIRTIACNYIGSSINYFNKNLIFMMKNLLIL